MLPGPFSIRRTRHHHPRSRPQGRISSVNSKVGTPIYPIVFASRRRRCRMYLSCSKSTDCNQSILYPCLPTILCSMFYNTICLQLCSFLKSQVSKITDPAHLTSFQDNRSCAFGIHPDSSLCHSAARCQAVCHLSSAMGHRTHAPLGNTMRGCQLLRVI